MKFAGIWTVLKKEFSRFFKDRRLVISLFLPGILIYVLYSLMGTVMTEGIFGVDEEYTYRVACVNAPAFLEELPSFEWTESADWESAKEAVVSGEADLAAVFPEDFNVSVSSGGVVELYYDSVRTESAIAYETVAEILSALQYDEPKFLVSGVDCASEEDVTGMIFSMVAPMLVMMMLFTGCISIAPESIAGEKERGTLATMLVTPVKRSHIALGKILAVSVVSLLSGTCSFFAIMLSLPKLMGGEATGLGAVGYGVGEYALVLGVVLASVLLMVALTCVVSAFAKNVKEASGYVAPLTAVVALLGLSSSFTGGGAPTGLFFVPLLNSALALGEIFSFAANPLHAAITIAIDLGAAALLALLLTKMFHNEKIVFGK